MNKADIAGGVGVVSTLYSWVGPATEVVQLLAAILGVVATGLAICLYIKKILEHNRK